MKLIHSFSIHWVRFLSDGWAGQHHHFQLCAHPTGSRTRQTVSTCNGVSFPSSSPLSSIVNMYFELRLTCILIIKDFYLFKANIWLGSQREPGILWWQDIVIQNNLLDKFRCLYVYCINLKFYALSFKCQIFRFPRTIMSAREHGL